LKERVASELRECRFRIGEERRNIVHVIRRRNRTGLVTMRSNCRQTHVIEGKKGWENEEEDLRSYCIRFTEKRRSGISKMEH
jgi:hypothetical protein